MRILFIIAIIAPGLLFGQKNFKLTIVLPDSATAKKFSFYYYEFNKRAYLPITANYNNNKVTISHNYNTLYAQLSIEYGFDNIRPILSIVVSEKPATLILPSPINETDPFKKYTLLNARDFKKESSALNEYIKAPRNIYLQMYDSIRKAGSADSFALDQLKKARINLELKRLAYISSHPNSYYSLSVFEKVVIDILPPELLLQRFISIFPAKFRNSQEGRAIKKYIENRSMLEGSKKAVSFTTTSIDNKEIILKEIYKNKNVLLVFWGTWCRPCIEEIPLLREMRKRYSKENLEIISVASQSKPEKVRQLIEQEQMDWIHIVNQEEIIQLYQVKKYPQMYLIDKKGDIIYQSSDNLSDQNLEKLKDLLDMNAGIK